MTSLSSPCNLVCAIEPISGYCYGCGRTLAEIGHWSTMNASQRNALNALLPERVEELPRRQRRKTRRRARAERLALNGEVQS